MEREMCSYLEWQLNVDPSALQQFEKEVQKPQGLASHYALPAPPSGPFAHPKPSTNTIPTAIPSFGPGAPSSPPSSTPAIPQEKSSRRSSADSYPATSDRTHLPTPPALHSDVSSPANSMSPVTPSDASRSNAKIVSSAGSNTMQIPGDNVSPPYHHHVHSRKSSSPIPVHSKSQHIDTKHTSPKKSSGAHQHAAPTKSNTVYAFARPCVW